jgi:hypothetical protein
MGAETPATQVWRLVHERRMSIKTVARNMGLVPHQIFELLAREKLRRDAVYDRKAASAPAVGPEESPRLLAHQEALRERALALLEQGMEPSAICLRLGKHISWLSDIRKKA